MHWLTRATVLPALAGILLVFACVDSNEAPAVVASIEAFSATPQVVLQNENVELRWRVSDTLVFRLSRLNRNAVDEDERWLMPDETQPWVCMRNGNSMECSAPDASASGEGWSCGDGSCSRAMDDSFNFRTIDTPTTATPIGSYTVWPEITAVYRIEAEGNAGQTATAWVQVVVGSTDSARIVHWHATPSPALAGEPVTLEYQTEGCEGVDYAAWPPLGEDELEIQDGYTDEEGVLIWHEADETRDFYFGCHPVGADESVRIRSHISVPVIDMPEICERIDYFSVVPAGNVEPGTEITVEWRVSNPPATSVGGEAVPQPSDREFRIGSARFEGTWTGRIYEDTTFIIRAFGECQGAQAQHTVSIAEDCTPDCAARECGDDGCGGSCGSCPDGFICDPAGECISDG